MMKRSWLYHFVLSVLACLTTLPGWGNDIVLREVIRRKAEEAAVTNCQIGGKRVCARQEVLSFYEQRLFEPAWKSPKDRQQLLDVILASSYQGLEPADYYYGDLLRWHQQYVTLSVEDVGNLEVLFTDAMLLYATHVVHGKVSTASVDPKWYIPAQESSFITEASSALASDSLSFFLENLMPVESGYQQLQQALQRYEALARQGGWGEIVATEDVLEVGVKDSAVLTLRKRLFATQDLSAGEAAIGLVYDSVLYEAVSRFQQRHGLAVDGRVGKATLEALNIPLQERILQIKTNLERWRWLPQKFSPYRLQANIPDFSLRIYKNGKQEKVHDIIVGKFYRQTPVFVAEMKYIVFNPTWTVPPTILSQDVLPAVRKSTSYLTKHGIDVYGSDGKKVDITQVDWSSSKVRGYTYRQGPGPNNALGIVKFMFPNPHMVYLHDTPAKSLFSRTERAFSSGCMRVNQPLDVAAYVLEGQGWSRDKIDKAIASQKTQSVILKQQPEVMVVYFTAWVDDFGILQFRKDIYQRDAKLQEALFSPRPY